MPTSAIRHCHKCHRAYRAWRCPWCYGKSHGRSSSSARSSASRPASIVMASSSPIIANLLPIWETDPARFWGQIVEVVRPGHTADGYQFLTAVWNGERNVHTFALDDVIEHASQFWAIQPVKGAA
jgi:hypothetical protein